MYTLISFSGRYLNNSDFVGIKTQLNKDILEVCGMSKQYLLVSKKGQWMQDKLMISTKHDILNVGGLFNPALFYSPTST